MTPTRRFSSRFAPLALAGVLALALAAPASASVASEQQQGAQIVHAIASGKLARTGLSNTQYERVGEYLMGRAFGTAGAFSTMDSAMDRAMGQTAATAMYTYLGERYLGVNVTVPSGYAPLFGWMGAMMSRYPGSLAGMMSHYLSGANSSGTTMGSGMMNQVYDAEAMDAGSGWPPFAIVAVAVLGAILVALIVGIVASRMRRDHPTGPVVG
jgi:hypothetical protein